MGKKYKNRYYDYKKLNQLTGHQRNAGRWAAHWRKQHERANPKRREAKLRRVIEDVIGLRVVQYESQLWNYNVRTARGHLGRWMWFDAEVDLVTESGYIDLKHWDTKQKVEWCKEHNIPLLIIPRQATEQEMELLIRKWLARIIREREAGQEPDPQETEAHQS